MRIVGRRDGFSLVELMIVVAVLGILAAIAIPNSRAMTLKSRRAEVAPSVDGLRTHVQTYAMVNDTYLPLAPLEYEVHGGCDVDGDSMFHDVRAKRASRVAMNAGDENLY